MPKPKTKKKPATIENQGPAVVMVPVDEIQDAPYNPRDIGTQALEGLKTSLELFGMPQPLVVNKRSGILVSGHQRMKAALALGWKEVPVIFVDLDDAREKALNVALNNQRIMGFFTEDLGPILEELKIDLDPGMFEALRLDELQIPDSWQEGLAKAEGAGENLDGITVVFKVKCPQAIKDEVLMHLKRAFLETSFEGVEIV